MDNIDECAMMKAMLLDMKKNPIKYKNALSSGHFIAGFGGDLNGVNVPETLITGKIPPGMTVEQAYDQVVQFMAQTIIEAQQRQLKSNKDSLNAAKPILGIEQNKK